AMIALHGRCALGDFEEAAIGDPDTRAFFARVRRIPVDKSEGEFPTRVEVELNDGTVHSIAVEMPVGSLAAPLSAGQYETKFDECAAGLIPADGLADLKRGIEDLANLKSIAAVTGPLANGWAHHG